MDRLALSLDHARRVINNLLFGVTSYANMPASTYFRDFIHYHAAE